MLIRTRYYDLCLDANNKPVNALVNGVYQVPPGTYSYTVSKKDYLDKSGTVVVTNSNIRIPITLEMKKHNVNFNINLNDAKVALRNAAGDLVTPETTGGYRVFNGTHKQAACANNETGDGSLSRHVY